MLSTSHQGLSCACGGAQLEAMDLRQLRNGGTLENLLAQLGEKYEPERLAAALKEREFEMAARAAGVVTGFGTWLARITAVRPGGLHQQFYDLRSDCAAKRFARTCAVVRVCKSWC